MEMWYGNAGVTAEIFITRAEGIWYGDFPNIAVVKIGEGILQSSVILQTRDSTA